MARFVGLVDIYESFQLVGCRSIPIQSLVNKILFIISFQCSWRAKQILQSHELCSPLSLFDRAMASSLTENTASNV